jgi:hypothetical protein
VEEYSANVIAQNLYSQLDSEGHGYLMLDAIVDFRKDSNALPLKECFIVSSNGNIHKHSTTQGWFLCIEWKDGSTSWEPLKDLKESFPIQVAEFSISKGFQEEEARKNHIVNAMKSQYVCRTHKYGIQLPKSIKEGYEIDRESGTEFWHCAILKEMTNNASAFQFLEPEEEVPVGSTWIPCHMIFNVKVDLMRKAHFVAGGHWTDPPSHITFHCGFTG